MVLLPLLSKPTISNHCPKDKPKLLLIKANKALNILGLTNLNQLYLGSNTHAYTLSLSLCHTYTHYSEKTR
jgi:hypothetical protein